MKIVDITSNNPSAIMATAVYNASRFQTPETVRSVRNEPGCAAYIVSDDIAGFAVDAAACLQEGTGEDAYVSVRAITDEDRVLETRQDAERAAFRHSRAVPCRRLHQMVRTLRPDGTLSPLYWAILLTTARPDADDTVKMLSVVGVYPYKREF